MTVIKIEDLWKEYNLGAIGYGTLSQDLNSWWASLRNKEDPNSSLISKHGYLDGLQDRTGFWALQGINLEVKKGDALGIIGKNGAGKSTLLKILAQVTSPTRGLIKIKGRIGSLLEVGTGFHPELTGRENIFMNGCILGMSKGEISRKLEQIINFSGVEEFIETPVKRYSSGMRVRLAFSVAAHLEPEILIVDEILAVGDIEFRNKCISKMGEVRQNGCTILFVSHNMSSIEDLCTSAIIIDEGQITHHGAPQQTINRYLSSFNLLMDTKLSKRKDRGGSGELRYTSINLRNADGDITDTIKQGDDLFIHLTYEINNPLMNFTGCHFTVGMRDFRNRLIFSHHNLLIGKKFSDKSIKRGKELILQVKSVPFKIGKYNLSCDIVNGTYLDKVENVASLSIIQGTAFNYTHPMIHGMTAINADWAIKQLDNI